MRSILQSNTSRCILCKGNANIEPLDKHHVFFGANRKKSEKYGLTVYLHHSRCHIFGEHSVHVDPKTDLALKKYAQQKAMKHYGWTVEDFIRIFGKNYL